MSSTDPLDIYGWELNPLSHVYTFHGKRKIDGQYILGVTNILQDDGLAAWVEGQTLTACAVAANNSELPAAALATGLMPNQIRDGAAGRGTAAHLYLQARLERRDAEYVWAEEPVSYGHARAINAFLADWRPELVYGCERRVGHRKLAYCGTYDASVTFRSPAALKARLGHTRLDLKTSKSIRESHPAQLVAYEDAARDSGEGPARTLAILHIDELGNYQLLHFPARGPIAQAGRAYFRGCLTRARGASTIRSYLRKELDA